VVGRAWICQLYDSECCLGSHTLKWPVGVVFIATNQIVAIGEGCWRWAHRTVSSEPPRHLVVRAWSWSTVRGSVLMWHRTVQCYTRQSGAPLTNCSDFCRVHCSVLFTVRVDRCVQIVVAPLLHRTVRWHTGQSGEL
jgi:fatty-acid desaturase